jgi:hypothetical protein
LRNHGFLHVDRAAERFDGLPEGVEYHGELLAAFKAAARFPLATSARCRIRSPSTYLKSPRPAWPEVVDAADWLRGELGVSQSLWGEACITMGREQAAISIAIVSAKPETHFRSTPGGYFHGMVMKAKAGELNLARTVWGLRQTAASGSRRGFSYSGSSSCA